MAKNDPYDYYQTIGPNGLTTVEKHESIFVNPVKRQKKNPENVKLDVKKKYTFSGSVSVFDICKISRFTATTYAISKKQAYNNILYQAKTLLKLLPNAGGVKLIGDLQEEERV